MLNTTDLYDLLASYGLDSEEYPGFHLAWAEGLNAEELSRRLGADPSSAFRCRINDLLNGDSHGVSMWADTIGGWVQAFLFWSTPNLSFLQEISCDGTRALSLECGASSTYRLDWAADGAIVTSFAIDWPDERGGVNPHALDPLMEGLKFQLDNPGNFSIDDPVTIEVSVTSALRLAGRITGSEINAEWLDAIHTRYSFRTS
ncbi:DUF6461 domain-containing protein [Streptosporangium canum]|uniref:DUF6461 domain-containing protein n=1 Tax=Streptosporangium canum TaxID=324952 RepID=UPI00343C6C7D